MNTTNSNSDDSDIGRYSCTYNYDKVGVANTRPNCRCDFTIIFWGTGGVTETIII